MAVIDIRGVHRIFETGAGLNHVLRGVSLTVEKGEFVAIMGPSGSGKSTLMNILGLLDTPTGGTYRLEGLDVSTLSDDDLAFVRGRRIGFVFQSFNLLPRATVLRNVMLPLAYGDVSRRERERTFERLRDRGKTIVLITHDPDVAARADRTAHIRDGRLVDGVFSGDGTLSGDGAPSRDGAPSAGAFSGGDVSAASAGAFSGSDASAASAAAQTARLATLPEVTP